MHSIQSGPQGPVAGHQDGHGDQRVGDRVSHDGIDEPASPIDDQREKKPGYRSRQPSAMQHAEKQRGDQERGPGEGAYRKCLVIRRDQAPHQVAPKSQLFGERDHEDGADDPEDDPDDRPCLGSGGQADCWITGRRSK